VLEAYGPVHTRVFHPSEPFMPSDREGTALGFSIEPFPVVSKPPPYMYGKLPPDDLAGDTVGLVLVSGGRRVVYVPGVRELDARLAEEVARADLVLIDGTCFTDDELVTLGVSTKTARAMGHAPLAGEGGILAFLARYRSVRRALIHVNNSNPVLWERGEVRRLLDDLGVEVTRDGWSVTL
jgi:pyrroloquinoline quinone biosynthesis protein B